MQFARSVRTVRRPLVLGLMGMAVGCSSGDPQGASTEGKAPGKAVAEERKASHQSRKQASRPGKTSGTKAPETVTSPAAGGPG
jgi:hypothetical protein